MAPHSSTLTWKIPWTEEPAGLPSMGLLRVRHDWATSLWLFTFMHWRRKWQPTPVFLPGESQGQQSLVGCHLWGRTESDMTVKCASINIITWTTALSNSIKLWSILGRTTQADGSWWRVLTKCGPLEKRMTTHFSVLALRTPWSILTAVHRITKRHYWATELNWTINIIICVRKLEIPHIHRS